MSSWSENTHQQINDKLKGIKEKDLRFYRINEFKRNVTRVDKYSGTCLTCKKETSSISETIAYLDEAIKVPGKKRRDYDRLISRLSKHMQKEHGFFPPYYFTYFYSFIGIISGLAAGYLLFTVIADNNYVWVSLGFFIGIISGYLAGNSKDKKIRRSKMLM